MNKKIVSILLGVLIMGIMVSCAGKKNGEVKLTDANGNVVIVGEGTKWPGAYMANLPEVKGKLSAVYKDEKTKQCTVAFGELSNDEAAKYIAALKNLGYANGYELSDVNTMGFTGYDAAGNCVIFTYDCKALDGSVAYYPAGSEGTLFTGDSANNGGNNNGGNGNAANTTAGAPTVTEAATSVDMSDAAPWPNFLKDVPELKGKITDVINSNNENVTVSLEYVDRADFEAYVATLKQKGFTVDPNELKSTDSYEYAAYNAAGEFIYLYFGADNGYTGATVSMSAAPKA